MTQKKVLILCHGPNRWIGQVGNALIALNFEYDVVAHCEGDVLPDAAAYDGFVIMGGAMGVPDAPNLPWLQREMDYIESFLKLNKPVLGICLGCQILAKIYGNKVFKGENGFEIGMHHIEHFDHDDDIFGEELKGLRVLQWHQDTFTLEDEHMQLCSNDTYDKQAAKFAHKVYGVQFHPEATPCRLAYWAGEMRGAGGKMPEGITLEKEIEIAQKELPQVHAWFFKFIERLFK